MIPMMVRRMLMIRKSRSPLVFSDQTQEDRAGHSEDKDALGDRPEDC